jgi:hypothetical protein
MHGLYRLKYILLPFLLFVVITVLYYSSIHDVFAQSLSFPRQQILDDPNDWIDLKTSNITKRGYSSTDILAVHYWGNGKYLNATLWLLLPFNEQPSIGNVNYGMLIDADFNDKTGFDGIDYKIEISWNNEIKRWSKILEEWSPYGKTRVLDNKTISYTDFSKKGAHYVLLSADLDAILSPKKYKVLFYGEVKKEEEKDSSITDFTKWVAIPPLELDISTSPSFVELRKGEEKTIEVKVNSTQGYEPTVNIYTKSQSNDIKFNFKENDTLRIPTYGVATTPLTITSSEDATIGPFTLFIFANSTFPPEELIQLKSSNISDSSFLPPSVKPENIITQSSLLVTLQDPLTIADQISNFWNKVGDPLSFIYGIVAGISPWIYTKIKGWYKKD